MAESRLVRGAQASMTGRLKHSGLPFRGTCICILGWGKVNPSFRMDSLKELIFTLTCHLPPQKTLPT